MRKPLPVPPKLLLAYGVYTVLVSVHLAWALKAMEWPWVVLAGGGGWVFWTFFEYLLHRWGFHEPPGAPAAHKYDIHWDHHRVPQDPERIITSLWLSLPIAALFWGLLWLINPGYPRMGAVYAGIGIGYLGYETLLSVMVLISLWGSWAVGRRAMRLLQEGVGSPEVERMPKLSLWAGRVVLVGAFALACPEVLLVQGIAIW